MIFEAKISMKRSRTIKNCGIGAEDIGVEALSHHEATSNIQSDILE